MRLKSSCLKFVALLILSIYEIPSTLGHDDFEIISSKNDHPLLQSLTNFDVLSPHQYGDYHHSERKDKISTEIHNRPGVHHTDAYFSVEFEGKKYTLDLSLNHELLPESYAVTSFSKTGERLTHKPAHHEKNHCYYQGYVREVEGSQVIASTCSGLRGIVILPNDLLIIEPLSDSTNLTAYVIYRPKDRKDHPQRSCGNDDNKSEIEDFLERVRMYSEMLNMTHSRSKREAGSERRFVELMIVAERLEAAKYRTRIVLDARIKELVNYVDGFYQKLGVRVVLSHVEVWNRTDRIPLTDDPQRTLDDFLAYRIRRMRSDPASSPWRYTDNVQLIYGGDFEGSTIGMATVGSMCGSRSGGVNQDHSSNVFFTASTVAHEMGHNFGMRHDTSSCSCPSGAQCIMASSSGPVQNRAWSSCSRDYLEESLRMGLTSCLTNVPDPSRLYGGPECGNDIVEEGEECDCGEPDFCPSQCCNPRTCRFVTGAVCDAGMCCDNCQFVRSGTECRTTDDLECELPEYCTGTSPYCPTNVFKEDGTRCLSGTAACHDGICLTHVMQCQNIWGPSVRNGPDTCYERVNSNGNDNGNCGLNGQGQFIPCTRENSKCGKLMCVGGSTNPMISGSRTIYTNTFSDRRGSTSCRTVGSDANARDVEDPGLVLSGTMCDTGKACLDGVCRDLPNLTCTARCNGNGVCNNLGNCHCNSGFAPPFCSAQGNGGSIDSGPIRGRTPLPPRVTTTTRRPPPSPTTTPRGRFPVPRPTTPRRPRPTTPRRPRPTTPSRPIPIPPRRPPTPIPTTTPRRLRPTPPRIPIVPSRTTTITNNAKPTPPVSTTKTFGSSTAKTSDGKQSNTQTPVAVIVAIVLVVLLLIIAGGLIVWCKFYGGISRVEAWRKKKAKERNRPAGHAFQPVATEDRSSNVPVSHTANTNELHKQPVSVSRENLIDSNSTEYYPTNNTPAHGYYSNNASYAAGNSPTLPHYQPPPYQPTAPPPVNSYYSPPVNSYSPPVNSYSPHPPQLPTSKPPLAPSAKPPVKPSTSPKPFSKPSPPVKPAAKPFTPNKPAVKPSPPTKPTLKPSNSAHVVRSAPPPPTAKNGARNVTSKPPPILPIKPNLKPGTAPRPQPLSSTAPRNTDTPQLSVAERARRLNGY